MNELSNSRVAAVIVATAAMSLLSCRDATDLPSAPQSQAAVLDPLRSEATTGPLPGQQMFSIHLEIDGEPRAGTEVTVTVSVLALAASKLAEVRVLAPEMEVAQSTGWGRDFRIPVGTTLPAKFRWAGPLAVGQTARHSFRMAIPASGFYRLTAQVRDISTDPVPLLAGHLPQTTSEQEKWLFVGVSGGHVLDRFDPSRIPTGYLLLPGPLRPVTAPAPLGASGASPTLQFSSGTILWQFLYFDSEVSQYRPIMYASWEVEFREGLTGPVTGTEQGSTDLNGLVAIDCRPGERYWGMTHTWGSYVAMSPSSSLGWDGQFDQDCGSTQQAVLTSDIARAYAIMSRTGYDANVQFGFSRAQIQVSINDTEGSFYSPSEDKIVLKTSSLPGEFGRFVIAHEYGHAYHHRAMGGLNPGYADNCNPHFLGSPSSYGCALSEGFADFFSAFLTGSLLGNFESNIYHTSGAPNPKTEGAVAAAFLDVADPANEAHDAALWSGSYLPRLIGTCCWQESLGGVYWRASGIDHITYCLEQDIDPFASNLHAGERSTPAGWLHSATVPPTWSKTVARPLWYTNIFE